MYKIVRIVVAGLSIALLPLSAYAGTISTPIIFQGNSDQLVCIASNVSTSQGPSCNMHETLQSCWQLQVRCLFFQKSCLSATFSIR